MPGGRKTPAADEVRAVLEKLHLGADAAVLAENFERYEVLGRGDTLRMEAFQQLLPPAVVLATVPNFTSDVHSLAGLRGMHAYLFDANSDVARE
jgi:hypothetical protein